jgi:hypothetical protein
VRRSLGLDLGFTPAGQKQKTPFSACMLDRNYQQRLDESAEYRFTRDRPLHREYSGQVSFHILTPVLAIMLESVLCAFRLELSAPFHLVSRRYRFDYWPVRRHTKCDMGDASIFALKLR